MSKKRTPSHYVDSEPGNYRCYHCGAVATFSFRHGRYFCDLCGQSSISGQDGAERMGQLPAVENKKKGK